MTQEDSLFDLEGQGSSEIARILSYLQWKPALVSETRNYSVWVHDKFRDEVVIPEERQSADFEHMDKRARSLLRVLHGSVEFARAVEVADAIPSRLDRTEWLKETSAPGLIPMLDGETLFESVKEQLAAAAKSRQERRPYYGNSAHYIAKDFLDHSLLGQSGIGSYILTAHTPSEALIYTRPEPSRDTARNVRDRVAYSGRQIITTLDNALGQIVSALDQPPDDAVHDIVDSVSQGISFELVRGLAKFVGGSESVIRGERPVSGREVVEREYVFKAQWGNTLSRSAARLAQDPEPLAVTLRGIVTSVTHEPESAVHVVRIFTETGGRVRVRLNAAQYDEAIVAHRRERLVSVRGRIEHEGRYAWINAPEHFYVVSSGEDDDEDLLGG